MRKARRGNTLPRKAMLVVIAVVGALFAGAAPAWADTGDASASGVHVDVHLLGAEAVKAGPFAAASTSGQPTSSFAAVSLPGLLTTGVINAAAHRDDDSGQVDSSASIVKAGVPLLGIGADVVEAHCTATQQGEQGTSRLAGLRLGGLGQVAADPAPNTTVLAAVAKIVFNEQVHNADGSLTVNAVHITLLGGALHALGSGDVVLASATCGPAGLPIPMASGTGLWLGLGLLALAAVPAGAVLYRRRTATA